MFGDSEVLTGPSEMVVYKIRHKWIHRTITSQSPIADRGGSLINIRDAFRSQGFEIDMT